LILFNGRIEQYSERGSTISTESSETKSPLHSREIADWSEFIEASGQGTWSFDHVTRQVTVSPQFWNMLGYVQHPLVIDRDKLQTYYHPEDVEPAKEAFLDHCNGLTDHFSARFRMKAADGSWRWIDSRGKIVARDAAGEPVRHIGVHFDVTREMESAAEVERLNKVLKEWTETLQQKNAELERSNAALQALANELAASDSRYKQLVEIAPIGVVLTQNEFIESANAFFCNLLGYEPAELEGIDARKLLSPIDAPKIDERKLDDSTGAWKNTLKVTVVSKSGEHIPIEVLGTRVQVEPTIRSVVIVRDRREEERAQQALQESENLYRTVFDTMPDGVLLLVDGRITYANSAAAELYGYSREQLVGMTADRIIHESHLEAALERIAGSRGQDYVCRDERLYRRQNGETFYGETTGRIVNIQGQRTYIAIVRDLSERIRAQRELEMSEERWQFALEGSNLGVWDADLVNNAAFWSRRWYEILGYEPGELRLETEQDFRDLVHPDDADFANEQQQAHLEGKTPFYESEFRMRCKDGSWKWIRSRGRVTRRDDNGRALRMVGTHMDISLRKQAEQEIRALNQQLTQRAQELEVALRELEAFSYSVSHDLRGPLRAIDMYSASLALDYEGKLDANAEQYIQRIRRGVLRMSTMIDDLLKLSRVSRHELRRANVDLTDLAKTICAELTERHPTRSMIFEIQSGMIEPCDIQLVRVLLQSLFDNAVKFTSRVPQARITFGMNETGGGRTFFVRDNGDGFDGQNQSELFKPFSRLHGVEEFEGHGIGLATAERVVSRHNGRIWAESVRGEGACFYFTLQASPQP
jgi:PAS domain S-box-containing protein